MTTDYDSTADTLRHKKRVLELMADVIEDLLDRAVRHDDSKLREPEKATFDAYTPQLRELEYDSPEYRTALAHMHVGLDHHYAHNPHHPQYHEDGIHGMSLLDLLEMLADWKAAGERGKTGSLHGSIVKNRARFGYGDEIDRLLFNTAQAMGWL